MRPTEKYRALLTKQRKAFQDAFEKLFLSVDVLLDSVDQALIEQREQKKLQKQKAEEQSVELRLRK